MDTPLQHFKNKATSKILDLATALKISDEEVYRSTIPLSDVYVGGALIRFPFERPYRSQLMVMSKAIAAMRSSEHALLESPTGTGKSMALLSAALAWQRGELQRLKDECDPIQRQSIRVPRIYFCSRTHSQLAQAVGELRKLGAEQVDRMTLLGSRQQYCVNPALESSRDKQADCRALLEKKKGACSYFQSGLHRPTSLPSTIWDVEDLLKAARSQHTCAYFDARRRASSMNPLQRGWPDPAHIVLCPYNYILDPALRKSLDLSLEGSIIIIDESHNVETVLAEAASCEWRLASLQLALADIQRLIDCDNRNRHIALASLHSAIKLLCDFMLEQRQRMIQIDFEMDAYVWSDGEVSQVLHTAFDCRSMFELIDSLRVCWIEIRGDINDGPALLVELENETNDDEGMNNESQATLNAISIQTIDSVLNQFGLVFPAAHDMERANHFRLILMHSRRIEDEDGATSIASKMDPSNSIRDPLSWSLRLALWCMNGGVIFAPIARAARSVILASGTLSPLPLIASELSTSFPHRVLAPHVVSPSQLFVFPISRGPSGNVLRAVYKETQKLEFQDELGLMLLQVCQVVPHGVLVFVSSYSLLNTLLRRWRATGLWNTKLSKTKQIFFEQQGQDASKFTEQLRDYRRAASSVRGAIMLAVTRGRLSEGIDLADQDARAVIVIGIPYPNFKSLRVKLKREYNDLQYRKQSSQTEDRVMSGAEWYEQQAFRALNQAIGRCIRHSNDYGAILLVDERFSQEKYTSKLSSWARDALRKEQSFPQAILDMRRFYEKMKVEYPLRQSEQDVHEVGDLEENSSKQQQMFKRKSNPSPNILNQSKKSNSRPAVTAAALITTFFKPKK